MAKIAPHSYTTIKIRGRGTGNFPWSFCRRCGFVYLKNEASMKTARKGCEEDEDG